MDTIQFLWQRIETWMSTYAPQSRQRLLPGASETDIQRAEAAIGILLPEDFKASYRLHNGGYALDAVSKMEILSLKDIISDWQMYPRIAQRDVTSSEPT